MSENISIESYNNQERANNYNMKKGFDPKRKEEMLNVTLCSLMDLTTKGDSLLELGSGSGLFTKKIIDTEHFNEIFVTDGAETMLEIAENTLSSTYTKLNFHTLDFTRKSWSKKYRQYKINAVSSTMALHHAENKKALFKEVYNVLNPGGVFVLADHMAGSSALIDRLIGNKRARIKLSSGREEVKAQQIKNFIQKDKEKQEAEGNKCESVIDYIQYLQVTGFDDVDCLWRDYWLAVFVAKKPE